MSQQYSPSGFNLLPPVVKNLLIINGLFYLATVSFETAFGIDLVNLMGLHFFESDLFRPYQFVSYMFLHGSISHVVWNMFALWMFGYLLENVWGSKRFLTYYMITGIGAAIIQSFVTWYAFAPVQVAVQEYQQHAGIQNFVAFVNAYPPHTQQLFDDLKIFLTKWNASPLNEENIMMSKDYITQVWQDHISTPTVGASGAVYGILLAFGMMFPNMLIYVYFLPIIIFFGLSQAFEPIISRALHRALWTTLSTLSRTAGIFQRYDIDYVFTVYLRVLFRT